MNNNCGYHEWENKDNEPCPYCIIDQLRFELDHLRLRDKKLQQISTMARGILKGLDETPL